MKHSDVLNPILFNKYDINYYAMYGEYPHKSFWSYDYTDADVRESLGHVVTSGTPSPSLLYVHMPFCQNQCLYCVCHTVITRDYQKVKDYLQVLYAEIDLLRDTFERHGIRPRFNQLHFGGGSPSWLTEEDFDALLGRIGTLVDLTKLDEIALEIDPRGIDTDRLHYYHARGVNRISFGIQDFNPEVQKAINRIQPVELIDKLLTSEIRSMFQSINFDIMYGLPNQTRETFHETIDTLVRLAPHRTCLLLYNDDSAIKKHQTLLRNFRFPDDEERTRCFTDAVHTLQENGFERIGFEHFARTTDELAESYRERKTHWNSLGYTQGRYVNMIGIGSGSASKIGDYSYSQNQYSQKLYRADILAGRFPVYRGYKLSRDDIIRREVIQSLRSFFSIDIKEIENRFGIAFKQYFKSDLVRLQPMIEDGLLHRVKDRIEIHDNAKLLLALICSTFDNFKHRTRN